MEKIVIAMFGKTSSWKGGRFLKKPTLTSVQDNPNYVRVNFSVEPGRGRVLIKYIEPLVKFANIVKGNISKNVIIELQLGEEAMGITVRNKETVIFINR